jgi:hypothetical protein
MIEVCTLLGVIDFIALFVLVPQLAWFIPYLWKLKVFVCFPGFIDRPVKKVVAW